MTHAVLPPPLRRAVSPYTGIVRSLDECLHLPTEPPLFRVAGEVGRGRALLGAPLDHLSGIGGAGTTRAEAAAAAVGEALERYSATYVPREELVVASARDLGEDAVAPERFALFSQRQYAADAFPCVPFTAETPVPWVRGWAVADDRPAWLPAELVFLGDPVGEGAARVGYATSSGTACAPTLDEALLRGLCELLERDAFMIVWANRLSLPLLRWSRVERLVGLEARCFERTGLDYAAIDLSRFHRLPSVLAVARAPAGCAGALGVGAGTAPTIERAWWKALSEAFAARAAGAKLELLAGGDDLPAAAVVSFEDHIRYYAHHRRAEAAAFLSVSPERVAVEDVPELEGGSPREHVHALCARVKAAGSDAYAVDVTSPDVRELGVTVVKVVAPELCALDVPHGARFLGGRRLYEAAVAVGLRELPLAEDDVNPDPHPFP
jgi:ribosomal protein S12 methylthiotransferase accessory factor